MAKTKALISCAVTAHLICVFVFVYAKSRFSHNEAQIKFDQNEVKTDHKKTTEYLAPSLNMSLNLTVQCSFCVDVTDPKC